MSLRTKIDSAEYILATVRNKTTMSNPLLLFSGGKDSIVVAHLAGRFLGVDHAFCEMSLIPPDMDMEIQVIASRMRLNVEYNYQVTPSVLRDNWDKQQFNPKWKPSDLAAIKHWPSMLKHAKQNAVSMMIYGRRKEENTIPSAYYRTKKYKDALQVHPIWNWTRDDVFEYQELYNLTFPTCYEQGAKHLSTLLAIAQRRFRETGDFNEALDILSVLPEYVEELAKVDDRVKQYLNG